MDFDNRKVYGDTSITDGLVSSPREPWMQSLSIARSLTHVFIMTHLVEYIVHQLKCRPQRIGMFLNQLESIIDCNGLQ